MRRKEEQLQNNNISVTLNLPFTTRVVMPPTSTAPAEKPGKERRMAALPLIEEVMTGGQLLQLQKILNLLNEGSHYSLW